MLYEVREISHPALGFIQVLYESSFPFRERREWQQMLSLLSHESMRLMVVVEENTYVGFAIVWTIGSWHFVEHLAIDPEQRGKQYGSQVMNDIIEYGQHRIILEVEPGDDETAKRRIRFYEKLGLHPVAFTYQQPPYRLGEESLPMQLMSMPAITSASKLGAIAQVIKTTVYEAFY